MEKAKKGDLKMPMLKAKMMKSQKGETAKKSELGGISAKPMPPMAGLSASQPPLGGDVAASSPMFKIEKPKLEGEVELFGPTEIQEYAPVKSYIKKRGMK